ncbi:hypothetical protein C8R45DRAFT_1095641 [Mycena sanguinolenta]|nr:hypothetical protein C8R45DRAFT_1095641 [Mycena sanguinolenta]
MAVEGLTFEELLGNLSLGLLSTVPSSRTLLSTAPSSPTASSRTASSTSRTASPTTPLSCTIPGSTVYYYESPNRRGYTADCKRSYTGRVQFRGSGCPESAKEETRETQGLCGIPGVNPGVYHDWSSTKAMVNGVKCAIYRGYTTAANANKAFAYAHARGWTAAISADGTSRRIAAMPTPNEDEDEDPNVVNALH